MGKGGWLDKLRNLELAKKVVLTYIVLLILPLGITSWLTFHSYASSLEKNVGRFQGELIKQLTYNLDTYLYELEQLTITPYQSKDVLAFLERPRNGDEPPPLPTVNLLDQFVTSHFLSGRVDIRGVSLFGERGAAFVALAENPYHYAASMEQYPTLYRQLREKNGGAVFYRTHQVRTNRGSIYDVFSIGRQLKSLATGKPIGYIVVYADLKKIRAITGQVTLGEGENLVIVDETGHLVYRKYPRPIPAEMLRSYRGSGKVTLTIGGEPQLLAYHTSPRTGWTTFGTVPIRVLMEDTIRVRRTVLVVAGFCIGLALLTSVVIAWRITKPIRKLRRLMKEVEQGNLDVFFPVRSGDEIGQLGRAFNLMVSRMSELGFRLYELEIREKDAQIAALQSQINPHFLYNTLGSIAMYAEVQGNREVVQMTQNLSKLLRYSIKQKRERVTLQEEVQHVREYMAIQQIRFPGRVRFTVEVAEELLPCPVIPLILQPLVENAIKHGIEQGTGSGGITLGARSEGALLLLTVADDGAGMTAEQLEQLRRKMETGAKPDGQSGHGLVNVHRRLLLHYGPRYGMEISSQPQQGTKITLKLPLLQS